MKYRKLRFLSVICAASMLVSQGAVIASSIEGDGTDSSSGYTEKNALPIKADDLSITIEEKEYDGTLNAKAIITSDLTAGKDVIISANAVFKNKDVGDNKVVVLNDFSLSGEDEGLFYLDIDGDIEVSTGRITQRAIKLIPNDNQTHYTTDDYTNGISVSVTYDESLINENDNAYDIPNSIYIISRNNDYCYSLDNSSLVTERTIDNKNYKVCISENAKPTVNEPDKPVLNDAELEPFDSGVKISYYDDIGFVSNGKVRVTVSAKPVYGEYLTYYLKSDLNDYEETPLYNTTFEADTKDGENYRKADIQCSAEGYTKSDYKPLVYKYNLKRSETLIIDKEVPSQKQGNELFAAADNSSQRFLINGTITDNGSGIKSISYRWTKNSRSYRKNVDVKTGTNEIKFNNSYLFDYSDMPDNRKVIFKITDLADNYSEITVNLDDSGYIAAKPRVTSIKLAKDSLSKLDDFLHILSFGIYTNSVLTLKIKAEASSSDVDLSNKNVTVSLIDVQSNNLFTDVKTLNDDAEDGVITFVIGDKEDAAEKLSVKVENEYGEYSVNSLRELLQTVPNKSSAQWDNKTTNTNSDKWVFDKTPPEIVINLDNAYDNRYYIDSNTSSVTISSNDEMSGINDLHVYNQSVVEYIVQNESGSEILIEDEYNDQYRISNIESNSITLKNIKTKEEKKLDISRIENTDDENINAVKYELSKGNGTYYVDDCEFKGLCSNSGKYELISKDIDDTEYKFDIIKKSVEIEPTDGNDISSIVVSADNFVPGSNKLYVTSSDYAGNTSDKTFDVYLVDKTPEGELSFVSPYTQNIDSKTWILESDFNNSSNKKAFVKLMLKNETSSINYVDISLNGISVYRKTNTFFSNDLLNDIKNNNGVINIELDDDTINSIKSSDNYINNNQIHIQAVMKTSIFKLNSDTAESTVYVDKKNPVITKFEVTDRNSPLDKIVNILSFGIFHNDDLTLCIYTEDGVNDSGIDKAEISFDGKDDAPEFMNYDESKNCYTYSIAKGTEVFKSGISVTVTDKLGNKTKDLPSASNTEEANRKEFPTNFVMIEANKPVMAISTLEGDHRDSDSVWFYEKDFNSSDIAKSRSYVLSVEDKDSGIRKIDAVLTTKNGGKTINCTPSDKPFKGSLYDPDSKVTEKTEYLFSVDDLAMKADNIDGEYSLKITAADNAGNVSEPVSVTFNRDTTAPEVTGIDFSPVSENEKAGTTEFIDQNESIVKTNYGYYFKEDFSIKVKASDLNASSGLNCADVTLLKYNSDGTYTEQEVKTAKFTTGTSSGNNTQGVSEDIVIPKGFKGMFLVKVTDNTGNVSKGRSPRSFVSDNEKPEISVKSDHDPLQNVTDGDGNSIYTDDVTFTVTITDTKSGLKEIDYNSSSNEYNNISSYKTQESTFIDDSIQYKVNDIIDGWKVLSVDLNIVTGVEKTFTYGDNSDGKDIIGKFKAIDNSNNTNENETFKFTIDRVNPEIKKMYLNTSDGAEVIDFVNSNKLEYRAFYKDKFSVTTEAFDEDPSSGLNKMDYRFVTYDVNGEIVKNDTSVKDIKIVSNKTENVQIPDEFKKGQIFVKAYDNTEKNVSSEKRTIGVVIDNNAPTITIDKFRPCQNLDLISKICYNINNL